MAYFKPTSHLAQAANRSNASEFMGERKYFQASLQRSHLRRSSIMLALLLSVLVNVGWGQINSEYRFVQHKVRDSYPTTQLDTTVNLTMDCLAANGYGQWTASSQTNSPTTSTSSWVPNGWFLLGNRISESEIKIDGTTKATGVVAKGTFAGEEYQSHMKVAANLDGKVRYVWVNQQRNQFIVYGLNDVAVGQFPKHIDISFDGFPNPPINRQAVKQPITKFANILTQNLPVSVEVEWQDEFDIAIDEKHLYVVWSTPAPGNTQDVWSTVIDLNTHLPLANYPRRITTGCHKPTVAADIRSDINDEFAVACIVISNPFVAAYTVSNGVIFPLPILHQFDDPVNPPQWIPIQNVTHARILRSSVAGASFSKTSLYLIADNELLFYDDLPAFGRAKYVDGIRILPSLPMRPVLGSFPGYLILDKPIVAFANPYDAQNSTNNTFNQFHVLYQYMSALELGSVFPTRDPLLIARNFDNGVVNPDTRLCLNVNTGMTEEQVETDYNPYTPIGLLPSDPDTYVAAVNQMGIHVHWSTFDGEHMYSRDIARNFDEDIEENTLVTNNCWVSNGSEHGGTVGATLLPGKTMALWTDPNWGNIITGHASLPELKSIPVLHDNAKLIFGGSNVALNIGRHNEIENQNTKLVTLSHFICEFPVASQSLVINPNAVWEFLAKSSDYELTNGTSYSGYVAIGNETPFVTNRNNLTVGRGKILLRGKTVGSVVSSATLNLHGGTDFLVLSGANGTSGAIFDAHKSIINSLFESSIHPTNMVAASAGSSYYPNDPDGFTNGPEIGKITITGQAKIVNSIVESMHESPLTATVPDNLKYTTLTMKPGWQGTTGYQFEARNTDFRNEADGYWNGTQTPKGKGYERIVFEGNTENIQYTSILFDNCTFSDAPIIVKDPINGVTITNSDFTGSGSLDNWYSNDPNNTWDWVEFTRDLDLDLNYTDILIEGCNFTYSDPDFFYATMLKFSNFSKHHIFEEGGIEYNRILITGSEFSITSGGGEIHEGISLAMSSAGITHNSIKGVYGSCIITGIVCQGEYGNSWRSSTFICSNTLKYCDWGIITNFWSGYSKLNDISRCYEGHYLTSGVDNGAGMLFNNIYDNKIGVRLADDAVLDLAGVHTSSSDHYAAKNTFANNNIEDNIDPGGQIQFDVGSTTKIIFTALGSLNDPNKNGQNNFIRTVKTGTVIKEDNYIYCDDHNATQTIHTETLLNNVNNNFFRVVTDGVSATELTLTSGVVEPFEGMSFDQSTGLGSASTVSGISCGAPISAISKDINRNTTLSVSTDVDAYQCAIIESSMGSLAQGGRWQEVYDTGKYFVEHCTGITKTYGAFSSMSGTLQYLTNNPNRYTEYFHWLKKVLYYDPDTIYYCADVGQMVTVFQYFDTSNTNFRAGVIAIVRYILDSAHCDHRTVYFQKVYDATITKMHTAWKDTVTDSLKTPFNPYIPTLDEIDMGFLRGPQNSVTPATYEPRLGELIATRNPFTDILELKYRLDKSAMVRIDVYDLLGRAVYSEGQGYKAEGEHVLSLQSKGWASGSYYVRLSSPSGEVKTVKVVKE